MSRHSVHVLTNPALFYQLRFNLFRGGVQSLLCNIHVFALIQQIYGSVNYAKIDWDSSGISSA